MGDGGNGVKGIGEWGLGAMEKWGRQGRGLKRPREWDGQGGEGDGGTNGGGGLRAGEIGGGTTGDRAMDRGWALGGFELGGLGGLDVCAWG